VMSVSGVLCLTPKQMNCVYRGGEWPRYMDYEWAG
jgi:hypothetical protein